MSFTIFSSTFSAGRCASPNIWLCLLTWSCRFFSDDIAGDRRCGLKRARLALVGDMNEARAGADRLPSSLAALVGVTDALSLSVTEVNGSEVFRRFRGWSSTSLSVCIMERCMVRVVVHLHQYSHYRRAAFDEWTKKYFKSIPFPLTLQRPPELTQRVTGYLAIAACRLPLTYPNYPLRYLPTPIMTMWVGTQRGNGGKGGKKREVWEFGGIYYR